MYPLSSKDYLVKIKKWLEIGRHRQGAGGRERSRAGSGRAYPGMREEATCAARIYGEATRPTHVSCEADN